jgi:hypothetical protein
VAAKGDRNTGGRPSPWVAQAALQAFRSDRTAAASRDQKKLARTQKADRLAKRSDVAGLGTGPTCASLSLHS